MKGFRYQRDVGGFTLIELLITITVLAILSALAVPAYSDYTIRSKITECINGAAQQRSKTSGICLQAVGEAEFLMGY